MSCDHAARFPTDTIYTSASRKTVFEATYNATSVFQPDKNNESGDKDKES